MPGRMRPLPPTSPMASSMAAAPRDMKGSVAAFAAAAIDFVRTAGKFKGSISFLITGDEEGPAINGTVKVLQWMRDNGHIPDHCLVGEPSCVDRLGDTIKIGRRGSLSFTVDGRGQAGPCRLSAQGRQSGAQARPLHRPHLACEARRGQRAFRSLDARRHHLRRRQSGGQRHPVARRMAKFNIRFSPEHASPSLRDWVNAQIAAVRSELGGTWSVSSNRRGGCLHHRAGRLRGTGAGCGRAETGILPKLSTRGGTSDARFVKDYCPVLEFGPTNATIHQTDERIAIDELRATQTIYHRILRIISK